jgi:hypothetical protein
MVIQVSARQQGGAVIMTIPSDLNALNAQVAPAMAGAPVGREQA